MYVKFLFVSLLPIALARSLDERPGFWTHVPPGPQVNSRSSNNKDFEGGFDENKLDHESHDSVHYQRVTNVKHNVDHANRHGKVQLAEDCQNIEESDLNDSKYELQNEYRRKLLLKAIDDTKESHKNQLIETNQAVNLKNNHNKKNLSSARRHSRAIDTTTHKDISSDGTKHKLESSNIVSTTPSHNKNNNKKDQKSDTQKTPNIPEDVHEVISMIFNTTQKTFEMTTENKVIVDNEAVSKNDNDLWVWTEAATSTTTEIDIDTDDLGNRVSFTGDGCPKGEAKVLGQCVKKHE